MAFRLQDLMIDVLPGHGFRLANERCTCVISAGAPGAERESEVPPAEEPEGIPVDDPAYQDPVLPSDDCPADALSALAADLVVLKAQLRRDLGLGLQ
jgi:hypothetical protein